MLNEDDERYTGVRAMPTLAMAILEQCGICDMIDERIEPDPQRILTPGKAVKLMVGAMFMGMGRRPLYLFDRLYASAPLELLCGEGVVPKNLNTRAFSRALDDIFALDLPALTFDVYSRLAERYLIEGFVYHVDSTNFGVTAVVIDRDDPEAAIPEWNGHAKDAYRLAWYVILAVMFVVTVASIAFSDGIYGEDSIFNSSPTGIGGIDKAYQMIPAFIDCVKVVFIIYVIGKVCQFILTKALSGTKKGVTASKLLNSFIKYAVAIIAVLAVLSAAGVDTATLVASAGILSLVIGLGAQSLIADIIAGLFTIFEGEYQVGDIVVIDGWRGTVEEIGIRSTRVVDSGGNTKIINNSEITTVINQTQHLSVVSTTISIEYGENLPKVELIIRDNIDRIKASIP